MSSEGEFTIADLRAPGVGEFLGDALNYNLTDGSIDLGGRYRLALGSTTELDLTLPTVEISELALRARGVERGLDQDTEGRGLGNRRGYPG